VKHIKENCNTCGVELTDANWSLSWKNVNRTQCSNCRKKNNTKSNPNNNPDRMYVNGKYVPRTHPLYKAGRFKTFEGAAFSALKGYEKTTEGYVYIIANPSFDGWLKIGMAVDAEDRCNGYQTSSPHRDYRLLYARRFNDRRKAETKTMNKLKKVVKEHNGEWFKTDRNTAQEIIERLSITL
jgi:hypothetical protein|tara:strand:+ start:1417 stop:1962 length:546 start_codon:yes stop_codon:yes gene_type:complete